jgi:hypothetical protein
MKIKVKKIKIYETEEEETSIIPNKKNTTCKNKDTTI